MKIDIKDYDVIITIKKGMVHLYEYGKETFGVQGLKLEVDCYNLPSLTTSKIVTDENGDFYKMGCKMEYGEERGEQNV